MTMNLYWRLGWSTVSQKPLVGFGSPNLKTFFACLVFLPPPPDETLYEAGADRKQSSSYDGFFRAVAVVAGSAFNLS
jgi:hypothetical protein